MTTLTPKQLAKHFATYQHTYQQHAHHQRALAQQLTTELLAILDYPIEKALEIGAGTGNLTHALNRNWQLPPITHYYLNDLYPLPPLQAPAKHQHNLQGDISTIRLPNSLSLILSNAVLQWIDQPDVLFDKLSQAQAPNGILALSFYSNGHFQELKQTLGLSLNYPMRKTVYQQLSKHYQIIKFKELRTRYHFTHAHDVFAHLRQTGTHTHQHHFSFSRLKQAIKHYPCSRYGYPLTYNALLVIGKKHG